MKFNPLEWSPIDGEKIEVPAGIVQLRAPFPFGILAEAEGVQAAYGFDSEHKISLAHPATLTFTRAEAGAIFIKDRTSRVYHPDGEVFTNVDRLPQESEHIAEVTKALRMLKIEELAMRRRVRDQRMLDDLVRRQAEVGEDDEDDDDQDPEPEPKPKAKADDKPKQGEATP